MLRTLAHGLLDLCYPPSCLACLRPAGGMPLPLCMACLRDVPRAEPALLRDQVAALPVALPFESLFALWSFDAGGAVQRMQHALKYGNRPTYGRALGRQVADGWKAEGLPRPDVLVPIPLHRRRYLERGYNQSAWLAAGMAEGLGVSCLGTALRRPHATATQTTLSRSNRWANLKDAFTVTNPAALNGRRVLLVDDILTTGATVTAAARVLQDAGAAAVDVATLAATAT